MAEVVVIGAGPAGLMAALRSAQAGHRCTVVEAAEAVGGMAGSFEVAGQRVDYGSHRLHPATPERFLELFRSRLGSDLQVRPRMGRIRLHGRWIAFPLRAGDMVRNLPPSFGARVALDVATGPLRRRRREGPASFEDDVARRLGPTVAREFYAPYARKLYGVDAGHLDRELARRRVSVSGAGDVMKRVVRAARPQGRSFLYPRRGYGQLNEALADLATGAGVDVRLGVRVSGLEAAGDAVSVLVDGGVLRGRAGSRANPVHPGEAVARAARERSEQEREPPRPDATGLRLPAQVLRAEAVLSTMPIPALAAAVDPPPPTAVTEALDQCRTRAVVLAYLVVGRDQFTPFDAHYFPGAETVVSRLSEPKNYRDGDDPPGRTVLCAEIPCWPGDELWQQSDARLGELVAGDMERLGLRIPDLERVEVRRLPAVYPAYETATMSARAVVEEWLRSLAQARIVSLGRHGLGVLDNLHHVLAMGEAAAEALGPDGAVDPVAWSRSLEGFASHVVED